MNCEQSTTKSQLRKINLFLQNKPHLLNAQMNVSKVLTKDYENICLRRRGKTNPKQSQSKPIQSQSNPKPGTGSGLNYLDRVGKKAYRG